MAAGHIRKRKYPNGSPSWQVCYPELATDSQITSTSCPAGPYLSSSDSPLSGSHPCSRRVVGRWAGRPALRRALRADPIGLVGAHACQSPGRARVRGPAPAGVSGASASGLVRVPAPDAFCAGTLAYAQRPRFEPGADTYAVAIRPVPDAPQGVGALKYL